MWLDPAPPASAIELGDHTPAHRAVPLRLDLVSGCLGVTCRLERESILCYG